MISSISIARRGCGRGQSGRQSQHNRRHATKRHAGGDIESKKVIVVGPTVLMSPKALFDRGVSCAGGIYTTRVGDFLDVIVQAGSEYRFSANLRKNL